MFDDDDPVLLRVRAVAHELPGVAEKVSHGRPAFYTTKVFAYYGGSVRLDGEWIAHDQAIMVLPHGDDRLALLEDPRCFVPAYLGPSGGSVSTSTTEPTGVRWPNCSRTPTG
jgi:hypothetical protein